ncbi:MAG: Biopolymer transport protein TolR [Chthoniobacteraceae bacterium]|nr:Biopolymer transport protein TolR [Chthoniobacteraceae bacterium]MDB6174262.1 Biopolymer transport protein TolR [Chthoniobacteraceae bacterium]
MVDVVFVLMLFFMASAGSQIVEKELNINLPAGKGTPDANVVPIVIDIASDGTVSVNSQSYGQPGDRTMQPLRDWLTNAIESLGGKDPVIIRPASDAKHERIVDVLNAASAARVTNLTFS